MSKVLPCCQVYNNLKPCSLRTSRGDWELVWQCDQCDAYYNVDFNTNAGDTVIVTGLKDVPDEKLDDSILEIKHEKLDKFQLKNLLAGIDMFYNEREEMVYDSVDIVGISLNCPNCLIDPELIIDYEGQFDALLCRSCDTVYQLTPTEVGSNYEYRILRKVEQPAVEFKEEDHEVKVTMEVIEPTPNTEERIEETDNLVAEMPDEELSEVYQELDEMSDEEMADICERLDTDDANDRTPVADYYKELAMRSVKEAEKESNDKIVLNITYSDVDVPLLGKYPDCMYAVRVNTTKSYTFIADKISARLESDVILSCMTTDENKKVWTLDLLDDRYIHDDMIIDVILSEHIEYDTDPHDKYILSLYVLTLTDDANTILGHVLIHASDGIGFDFTKM